MLLTVLIHKSGNIMWIKGEGGIKDGATTTKNPSENARQHKL